MQENDSRVSVFDQDVEVGQEAVAMETAVISSSPPLATVFEGGGLADELEDDPPVFIR